MGLMSTGMARAVDLRLHVIPLSNSDSTKAYTVTSAQFASVIDRVNALYQSADIRFVFDANTDWKPMADTELNTDGPNRLARGNAIAASLPGKIVILLRWGSDTSPTGNGNAYPPPGVGPKPASVNDVVQNYVALPDKIESNGFLNLGNGSFVAHELGHYLGLYHTFPGWTDRLGPVYAEIPGVSIPSATAADQAVIDYIAANGGTVNALDGDGISDTPPDPSPALYQAHNQNTCAVRTIIVRGTLNSTSVSFTFNPDPDNIMGYYVGVYGICVSHHFSAQQIQRMRKTLTSSVRVALLGNWLSLGPATTLGSYIAPPDAVVGGQDTDSAPLYICRGERSDGSLQPGMFRSGSSIGCVTAWGTQQENLIPFEVLVTNWTGNFWDTNRKAVEYTAGEVPQNAVQGGYESSGPTLYYCRGLVGNSWQPGKIRSGFAGCNVPYGGSETVTTRYQVLAVHTPGMPFAKVTASNGTVPPDAIRGGVDTDGEQLYVCSANWAGGVHPAN